MAKNSLPLLSQLVRHQAFEDAYSAVADLLEEKDPRNGCIIPLLGPTRTGKTAVTRQLAEKAGPAASLVPMKAFVQASLPAQINAREIYATMLRAVGLKSRSGDSTSAIRDRLFRAIEQFGIRVIALDECNHMAERGSNLSARAAADHLKTVVDETGVSLVLSGLPRFQQIIDQNEQLRDRAAGTILFMPYDWQSDEERDAFVGAVDAVLHSLQSSGIEIEMNFEDLVRRLYGASGGRVPMMMRLMKLSVLQASSKPRLTSENFRRASCSMQQSGIPASLFFDNEEPDEVDLLRSFAAVMADELAPVSTGHLGLTKEA
ncbi:TniB family NTP-binding protein [Pontibaca salina]|uniref:TniB family NTP-binding protein n=1 Tax=Pontibaca salina TaxID=2795731 RepID=A0A934HMC6_9RHOB|nr:TniB family NTP-binding protein [Pontibaca salina]MBI6630738.1 TniB family NTP-binding protein [Pontibaca salina]